MQSLSKLIKLLLKVGQKIAIPQNRLLQGTALDEVTQQLFESPKWTSDAVC